MNVVIPLVKLALFGLILVLILGIWSMAKGKETAESMVEGNKLMRLRVALQAVALGLILAGFAYELLWR
jgi:phosphatidylglycerophosphate synthase